MMKFYAVKKGRVTGLFTNWDDCKKSIDGFSNAEFKSFKSLKDANKYLETDLHLNVKSKEEA